MPSFADNERMPHNSSISRAALLLDVKHSATLCSALRQPPPAPVLLLLIGSFALAVRMLTYRSPSGMCRTTRLRRIGGLAPSWTSLGSPGWQQQVRYKLVMLCNTMTQQVTPPSTAQELLYAGSQYKLASCMSRSADVFVLL
jgi:hypothetical protein